MKVIQLDRYLVVIVELHTFYKYSEQALQDRNMLNHLIEQDFLETRDIIAPFIVDSKTGDPRGGWEDIVLGEYKKHVTTRIIPNGLTILRQQLLEASHSIFEKYLCHVVSVYLHTFPEILMEIDKKVDFRVIANLKDNSSIFDYAVQKEVDAFGKRSLSEKKVYLTKYLKLTEQQQVWEYEGEDLWRDIDVKRQAIVHKDDVPDISSDYLLRAMHYFKRAMVSIAFFAQADQGVRLSWNVASDYIKCRDQPQLR